MYRALVSFTTKDYDIKYKEILQDDFTTLDEITEFLDIGYIEVYNETLDISENGEYDVNDYKKVDVNVSGSQYVIDYSEIGYNFIPQSAELDGVNYAKQIMENWDSSITNANQLYQGNTNLLYFPLVDTSNINDFSRCFRNCTNLKVVPLINTSNFTFCNRSFEGDSNLVDIPQFDFSKVTALSSIFLNCLNLSDESLNNILGICINATAYMQAQAQSNWNLSVLGLSDSQKTRCQTLSNWNAFVNAGWSA